MHERGDGYRRGHWLGAVLRRLGIRRLKMFRRAALRQLSNRQLADAGIDLALAGRGKAADARFDPNLDMQS